MEILLNNAIKECRTVQKAEYRYRTTPVDRCLLTLYRFFLQPEAKIKGKRINNTVLPRILRIFCNRGIGAFAFCFGEACLAFDTDRITDLCYVICQF